MLVGNNEYPFGLKINPVSLFIKRFLLNEKGKHEDVRLNEKIEKIK